MSNLIVASNPARRRKKTRRTAAQRAASKRNIRKAQAATRRKKRPTRRRVTRRRNPAARRYARRSNPPKLSVKGIVDRQLIPAAIGGAGAVLDDMLVNVLPIPGNFKSGWLRHVTKAVGAVAIGYIGAMFLSKRTADQLGAGAMTVVGYNVVRDLAGQFVPQLPLGEYLSPVGEYLEPSGLGFYGAGLNPDGGGMNTNDQFTRGNPYVDSGLDVWPSGGAYQDLQYG